MERSKGKEKDTLYWNHHLSCKLTIKAGYAHLAGFESEERDMVSQFTKIIWKLQILPKLKVFLWKLHHNAMAVKGNLENRGINVSPKCDYCGKDWKDVQHLFRFCRLARPAWATCYLAIRYILVFYSKDGVNSPRIEIFVAMLWSLWVTRNEKAFRDMEGHTGKVLRYTELVLADLEVY